MRVLITNVYSYKNKGDAAIVFALISEVKRVFGKKYKVDIHIQTADPNGDNDKYGVPTGSNLLWLLLSSHRNATIIKQLFVLCVHTTGLAIYCLLKKHFHLDCVIFLSKDIKLYITEVKCADMIIACGGGYLRTNSPSARNTLLLFITCLNFIVGYYLDKPIYMYSQSVGPVYGPLQRWLLKFSLRRTKLVEVREDISNNLLSSMKLPVQHVLTADPVFLLKNQNIKTTYRLKKGRSMHIGLTVRSWFQEIEKEEQYINAIAQLIDKLAKQYNAQVYYLPQVVAQNFDDDDRLIAKKVQKKVKLKEHYTLIAQDLHPFELITICGDFDFFIGTRMHSNLFSLINAKPVIAIEYEHKTRGIMQSLGIEDLVININDVNLENLQWQVEKVLSHYDKYVGLINNNLPIEFEKSRKAMDMIATSYRLRK